MKKRYFALLVVILILAVAIFYRNIPVRHTKAFVSMYAAEIENSIRTDSEVPKNLGCLDVSTWEGDHEMIEFVVSGWGIGSNTLYYGCYYSFDDVPLPFQNADVALEQKGAESWEWIGEGENRGSTFKLRDNWYYFEASF